MSESPAKVIVVQDGGRLHYALPVAIEKAGMLERMYTDYYVKRRSLSAMAAKAMGTMKPATARKMMARRSDDLPDEKVFSNPLLSMRLARRRREFGSDEAFWEAQSEAIGQWVLKAGFGDGTAILGYVRNVHPMLCAAARERELKVVADQIIAPMAIEQAEAAKQRERFADWQKSDASQGWRIMERMERETWPLADRITCASEYVREGLIGQGIEGERISVLPYPIDCGHFPMVERSGRSGPVTVGFVGQVGLRKGAPYFFEVARKLAGLGIRFVMVGGIALTPEAVAAHKGDVECVGAVPRPEVEGWLATFDILLFPSTCEGSAGSVMEAMASGLPVVTSPNSGSVVREGIEGFVRGYDDVEGLAACVEELAKDAGKRLEMGRAARRRAEAFDLDWYSAAMKGVFGLVG